MKEIERFNQKFRKLDNGCWEWTASKTNWGYAQFGYGKSRSGRAHRFAYEYYKGAIPKGYTIDHLCRNRLCVNPDHLEAVTNKENVLRGVGLTAINARKTHCKNGHELTGANLRIRKNGANIMRNCKACDKAALRRHRLRKKLAQSN